MGEHIAKLNEELKAFRDMDILYLMKDKSLS